MSDGSDTLPFVENEQPPEGFILAQDADSGEKFWVKPGLPKQGSIKHESVDELLPALRWTWRHLGPLAHWCQSFEAWELGFMRDSNPLNEVVIWVRVTYTFIEFSHKHKRADKKKVLQALVQYINGQEVNMVKPKYVPELERLYLNPPKLLCDLRNFTEDGRLKNGGRLE